MTRAFPLFFDVFKWKTLELNLKLKERNGINFNNRNCGVNSVSFFIYSFTCQRIINYSNHFNDDTKYTRAENMGHCILAVSVTFILSTWENGFPLKSYGNGVCVCVYVKPRS